MENYSQFNVHLMFPCPIEFCCRDLFLKLQNPETLKYISNFQPDISTILNKEYIKFGLYQPLYIIYFILISYSCTIIYCNNHLYNRHLCL